MEELCRAVMRGDLSVSWSEFQAACREVENDSGGGEKQGLMEEGGGAAGVKSKGCTTATDVKEDVSEECSMVAGSGAAGVKSEGCTTATDVSEEYAMAAGATGVTVELENRELWRQFDEITNEMIITKAGRRMFPLLQVTVSGLQPAASYAILLEFRLTVEHRWRFLNGDWQSTAGVSYSSEPPEQRTVYIHPSSPLTGSECMKDKLTFSKLKLSNKDDGKGKIKLQSLYRYQPCLHIVQLPETSSGCGTMSSHVFKETQFVAVTAYQNDKITQMKIKHNPYAKAFQGPQDSIFSRASREESIVKHAPSHTFQQCHHPHPPIALNTSHQLPATQQPYKVLCHPASSWPPISPTQLYDSRHAAYYTQHGPLLSRGYQQQHYDNGAMPPHQIGQWVGPRTQVHGPQLVGYYDNGYVQAGPPQLECYHTPM